MSATLALMREYGAPLTRSEYLTWNGLGKSYKPSPEQEAEMPKRFQLPETTHEDVSREALARATGPTKPKPSPLPARWADMIKELTAPDPATKKKA